jgi:hypothetical protein
MNQQKYIEDLKDIKEMMNKSSKFISLSGLSGIAAGVFALIGSYFAWQILYSNANYQAYDRILLNSEQLIQLLGIGLTTLLLSLGSGILFTLLKTRKTKRNIWDSQTKTLLINLFIPLVTGGIFCLLIVLKGYIGLAAPVTLLFYGLALVNASKYTLTEVRSLGILEIVLGLLATYFIGYGLLFWSIGFGLLHIVYGIIMELKYKS